MDVRTDPTAPLPPAPDPWAGSEMPSRRDGPPFHMTEMIEAEPAMAARILRRLVAPGSGAARAAAAIREAAQRGRPILVTGCGTSEHGALAVTEILREAMRASDLPWRLGQSGAPVSVQAFEAALDDGLGEDSLVIGISHEGGTWATNLVLERAKDAGARVALITCSDRSPGAAEADIVVATDEQDQSWCHTVGYLSPILAAAAIGDHLTGVGIDVGGAEALLAAGLAKAAIDATEGLARALAGIDRLIVVGSGVDRPAARELVLKVEEGAHLAAAMRDLETFLHGHLAGVDRGTGFVLVLTDASRPEERAARATGVLRAVAELGIQAGAILGAGYADRVPAALTPAGRLVVPSAGGVPAAAASLIGSAVPLQLLTERLARARGINPDPIRRDDPAYLRAADAAG
ncbi:MAG TPA: SIS domain-containing protein [Patescibacteria group bacterium]|jgi:fructoselysine-6-P-deglycase FrlB-like protein|nr:SIS domain-containing protein [Patescibacteria group bacterium]